MRVEALQLRLAKHALGEALAKAPQGALDALDLDDVSSDPEDHRAASTISLFISRTASRMPTKTARLTMAWPI